eukprot:970581-Alexandrium_andersonii.AAC.1
MFGHLVRAGFDRSQVFRVPAVWGASPPEPNVFTDGSVLHPRHDQARMGGASVVLPTAVLHDAHLVLGDFHASTLGGEDGTRARFVPLR